MVSFLLVALSGGVEKFFPQVVTPFPFIRIYSQKDKGG